jgi:hypothetical protein
MAGSIDASRDCDHIARRRILSYPSRGCKRSTLASTIFQTISEQGVEMRIFAQPWSVLYRLLRKREYTESPKS